MKNGARNYEMFVGTFIQIKPKSPLVQIATINKQHLVVAFQLNSEQQNTYVIFE